MTAPMGTFEWLLAASILLMLFPSLIMLLMAAVVLVTTCLAVHSYHEKVAMITKVRTLLGLASILIPTSFGSTFLVSLGLSSRGPEFLGHRVWQWYQLGFVEEILPDQVRPPQAE